MLILTFIILVISLNGPISLPPNSQQNDRQNTFLMKYLQSSFYRFFFCWLIIFDLVHISHSDVSIFSYFFFFSSSSFWFHSLFKHHPEQFLNSIAFSALNIYFSHWCTQCKKIALEVKVNENYILCLNSAETIYLRY